MGEDKCIINDHDKGELLKIARYTIAEELDLELPEDEITLSSEARDLVLGAFVTIHIKGSLRGCIGYIVGTDNLYDTIRELARSAAFSDPRFRPLTAEEYGDIDLEISLLSPIEPVESIDGIKVGRDGLIVSRGFNRGLLLPQVAAEYKWDLDEFLDHTCMKAGLRPGSWKEDDVKIEKFSAEVFSENDLQGSDK